MRFTLSPLLLFLATTITAAPGPALELQVRDCSFSCRPCSLYPRNCPKVPCVSCPTVCGEKELTGVVLEGYLFGGVWRGNRWMGIWRDGAVLSGVWKVVMLVGVVRVVIWLGWVRWRGWEV